MPEKVVFSQRAFLSLVCEVAEHLNTETGGLFLGYRYDDYWYVIETIDPGPAAILRPAYFEYEKPYVDHLLNKQARLYNPLPSVLGLWHRHPGSFDRFSNTDDQTNHDFVEQCGPTIISALVNIDPDFRLTVYEVYSPLRYQTIKYEVEDGKSCNLLRDYKSIVTSLNPGNSKNINRVDERKAEIILSIIRESITSIDEIENDLDQQSNLCQVEMWLEEFLKIAEDDIGFLSLYGITVSLSITDELRLKADIRGPSSEDVELSMEFEKVGKGILYGLGHAKRKYTSGAIKELLTGRLSDR